MHLFDPIPPELADALEAGLDAYNSPTRGPKTEFLIAERDGEVMVGGLRASVSRDALWIKHLWVAEARRGTGLGRKLMQEAEAEGKRRGARQAVVDTFSTQAPEFYEKLGYREFGRVADLGPAGDLYRVWLKKNLGGKG